jgi:Cu/Ag efflux pump CusA
MAVVIVGGLATSTLLNLFIVPLLYLWFGEGSGAELHQRKNTSPTLA